MLGFNGLDTTVKPEWGAVLDPDHAFAPGLWDFLVLNEGSGAPRDLSSQAYSQPTLTGTPAWSPTPAGLGLYCAGGASIDLPDRGSLVAGDFTFRLLFRPRTWPGGYTALADKGVGTREFSLFIDTSGNLSYSGFGGTESATTVPLGMASGSVWDLIVARLSSDGFIRYYINGIAKGTTGNNGVAGSPGLFCLGRNPTGGGSNPDVDYILCQFWRGRCLSASEVMQVHAEPYNLISPPATRRFFVPSTGGPPPPPPSPISSIIIMFQ